MRGFDSSVLLTVRRTKWASSYEWNILTGKVSTEYILVKNFDDLVFFLFFSFFLFLFTNFDDCSGFFKIYINR